MSVPYATIGDLAELVRGVTYDKTDARNGAQDGYLPLLRATNIVEGRVVFDSLVFVPSSVVSPIQRVQPGDIVLAASSGSLSVVGKAAMLREPWQGTFGAFCYVVRPEPKVVVPEYLAYFMQSTAYRIRVSELAAGVNINNLRREHVLGTPVPYVGVDQQQRIVEALDSQLSRLDAAVTSLESAQQKLKAYRASVLKAAVEGRLVPTEAELARNEGRPYEPADVLLERILKERRLCWEESELAKMKSAGKTPKDDRWKASYSGAKSPDTDGLPRLPEGWCWATTGQLFSFVTSGSRGWARYYSQSGPIFLRIGNLDHDSVSLDLSDIQHVSPPSGAEGTRTRVVPGDVLISITADVGMIAVVPDAIGEAYINQHISLARPVAGMNIHYLAWFLAAAYGGQRQFLALQRGATKVGLGLDDIRGVSVPIPPLVEQGRIVDEIERRLSVAAQCVSDSTASRRRICRLRQAVLRSAFEGKLVQQDPADGPGDVLLARIRAERAASAVTSPKAKRPRKLQAAS